MFTLQQVLCDTDPFIDIARVLLNGGKSSQKHSVRNVGNISLTLIY